MNDFTGYSLAYLTVGFGLSDAASELARKWVVI